MKEAQYSTHEHANPHRRDNEANNTTTVTTQRPETKTENSTGHAENTDSGLANRDMMVIHRSNKHPNYQSLTSKHPFFSL
jgi:hypothetical protein